MWEDLDEDEAEGFKLMLSLAKNVVEGIIGVPPPHLAIIRPPTDMQQDSGGLRNATKCSNASVDTDLIASIVNLIAWGCRLLGVYPG